MENKDLWNGDQYKANSSPQENSAMQIIDAIRFVGSETVLDIGCGDGKITKKLYDLLPNGKVIGIDASKSMISEAIKNIENRFNLSFFENSAENFHFSERFDFIFSFHALHWVKDKIAVFKNIRAHLNNNGKFVFITSGGENPNIRKIFTSNKWLNHIKSHGQKFHSTDENEIRSMLQESGLSIEKISVEYWPEYYSNINDLINWIMTWVPYATGLNNENAKAFSTEIAENIQQESLRNGFKDKIEFKTEMLSIKAFKS
jgi:trans-aconitate 2-methyltransferase